MKIGKISAVTIPSPDLSKSVEQYVKFLNYRLVDEGQVSKEEALAWKAENIEAADYIVLQPENSNDFAFRVIKEEMQGAYKDGKMIDKWFFYDKNGNLKEIRYFSPDF